MFFSVIPFTHSIGIQPLVYAWGDISEWEIEIGSLVEIPYGNTLENGIIARIHRDSPIDIASESFSRIKTIHRIITPKRLLASYQIDMVCEISSRYMIPIHRILGIFLPKPILSRLEKKNYEQIQHQEIVHTNKKKWIIHIMKDGIVTPHIVSQYLGWPTIVILPDDFAMKPYQSYFENQEDTLFMPNDMTEAKRAKAWMDITNGTFSIIYWTRKILYYNLSQYENIIYVEDALGHDYWHYPIRMRYNDILRIFSTVNPGIQLTILTSVPCLSTLSYFRDFTIKNI